MKQILQIYKDEETLHQEKKPLSNKILVTSEQRHWVLICPLLGSLLFLILMENSISC